MFLPGSLEPLFNFELEDCKLPKSNFNFDYWEYEKDKEKVATILAQIILENNNLITIFDNHGGCEKSYFYNKSNQEIKIDKLRRKLPENYKDLNLNYIEEKYLTNCLEKGILKKQ